MASLPNKLPKPIREKYSVRNETLFRDVNDNSRNRVEIEIGDSKQPGFFPQVKIMRWGNEVNFSIRAELNENAKVKTRGERIRYITPDYEVHQFDKPDASAEGGFEFEWLLPQKPETNILRASVSSKNVDFFYQPELTEEEKSSGHGQEERMVGSYAVWHANPPSNIENGIIYGTGKVAHIYRPEAIDDNGRRTWCELHISNGEMTVNVPQEFLDSAVYPVIVDPTFGYSTEGSGGFFAYTAAGVASSALPNQLTATTGDTITSFHVYAKNTAGGTNNGVMSCAAYTMSGGNPTSRLGSVTDINVNSESAAWRASSTISQAMDNGVTYCVGFSGQNCPGTVSVDLYYDSASAPGRINSTNTTLETSFGATGTDSGRRYSVYATYSAGGGSSGPANLKTFDGLAKASIKNINGLAIASVKTFDGLA